MKALVAVVFWTILWLSLVAFEHDMALHMTVQMPLLACVGLLIASTLRPREPPWLVEADWLGIPGLLAVVFATSFWMLPRMLDAALAHPLIDLAKFDTLPLLVGLPLGLSWQRLPGLGRAFLWAHSQAGRGRRPLPWRSEPRLRLLSARPAGGGRLDVDRCRHRVRPPLVCCCFHRLAVRAAR
jgi:hypothetical protein